METPTQSLGELKLFMNMTRDRAAVRRHGPGRWFLQSFGFTGKQSKIPLGALVVSIAEFSLSSLICNTWMRCEWV